MQYVSAVPMISETETPAQWQFTRYVLLGSRNELPDNLVSSRKKSYSPGNENIDREGIPTSRQERQKTGHKVLSWPQS